jgi:hypothetical protein
MRPPDATNSEEERRQVYNEDLAELTPSQLTYEMHRAALIARHNPRGMAWRGLDHISWPEWADERIRLCHKLLSPEPRPKGFHRPRQPSRAWVH